MTLTIIISIYIVISILLYIFYSRVIGIAMLISNIFFGISIILMFSTLFLPSIYTNFSKNLLEDNVFARQINYLDQSVGSVVGATTGVKDDLENTFNDLFGREESEAQSGDIEDIGLYDGFIDFMANIIKVATFLVSTICVFFLLYIRYSFTGVIQSRNLEKRVSRLEKVAK